MLVTTTLFVSNTILSSITPFICILQVDRLPLPSLHLLPVPCCSPHRPTRPAERGHTQLRCGVRGGATPLWDHPGRDTAPGWILHSHDWWETKRPLLFYSIPYLIMFCSILSCSILFYSVLIRCVFSVVSIGKWHLGHNGPYSPTNRGKSHWVLELNGWHIISTISICMKPQ